MPAKFGGPKIYTEGDLRGHYWATNNDRMFFLFLICRFLLFCWMFRFSKLIIFNQEEEKKKRRNQSCIQNNIHAAAASLTLIIYLSCAEDVILQLSNESHCMILYQIYLYKPYLMYCSDSELCHRDELTGYLSNGSVSRASPNMVLQ